MKIVQTLLSLCFKTADEIKRLEGVRSAESLVYYAKSRVQDLPRGHRKVDDKLIASLDELALTYKGQKYEESDEKYVDLINKIVI